MSSSDGGFLKRALSSGNDGGDDDADGERTTTNEEPNSKVTSNVQSRGGMHGDGTHD